MILTNVLAVTTAFGPSTLVIDDFTRDPRDVQWPLASVPLPLIATNLPPHTAGHTSGVPPLACGAFRTITVESAPVNNGTAAEHAADAVAALGFPWPEGQIYHGEVSGSRFFMTFRSILVADIKLGYSWTPSPRWQPPGGFIPTGSIDLSHYRKLQIAVDSTDCKLDVAVRIGYGPGQHQGVFVHRILTAPSGTLQWDLQNLATSTPSRIPINLSRVVSLDIVMASAPKYQSGAQARLSSIKVVQ